jgi:hypothetical protein
MLIMPTATATLQDLAHRINQQEADLARLRKAFEARQTHLAKLARRKDELQKQLQRVEAEIQAAGRGPARMPSVTPAKAPAPKAETKASAISLPQFLVSVIRQAKRPVTIKELAREVGRRKFPTTTRNVSGLIKSRVSELLRKGILNRAEDKPGVVLAQATTTAKSMAPKATSTSSSNGQKKMTASKAAMPARTTPSNQAPPLGALLMNILAKSSQPLKARELADRAKASGYKTKSRDFTNVVWVAVSKLNNVENIPGEGYRLKKAK